MALDERLKKIARTDQFRTQPTPGARGGEEGGDEGGGTAETVLASGPVGSRKLSPNEQGHTKPFVIASGTTLDDMTGYVYHGIRVDNFTPQFMRVHGIIDAYIPPNTYGVQIPVMMGSQKCWVTWEAPVGYTQPAAAATQSAIIYFTEALINPSAGIDIQGFVTGAAPIRISIDQIGGNNVLSWDSNVDNDGPVANGLLGVSTFGRVFGGVNWERIRSVLAASDGFAGTGLLAAAPSLFNGTGFWDRARALASAGDGQGVALATQPSSAGLSTISGANAAVTNTYTAVAGQKHRLTSRSASYSATPTGRLTITDGATNIEDLDSSGAGGPLSLPPLPVGGLMGSTNTNMTITLQAGGAAVIGRINTAKLTA